MYSEVSKLTLQGHVVAVDTPDDVSDLHPVGLSNLRISLHLRRHRVFSGRREGEREGGERRGREGGKEGGRERVEKGEGGREGESERGRELK